jgi:hypothetical protein
VIQVNGHVFKPSFFYPRQKLLAQELTHLDKETEQNILGKGLGRPFEPEMGVFLATIGQARIFIAPTGWKLAQG